VKGKEISGRELRRSTPEERLRPGEAVIVKKSNGKRFALTRVDAGEKSINAAIDNLFQEIPREGPKMRTDLSRVIIEDRE
jgi:hypothetical protein